MDYQAIPVLRVNGSKALHYYLQDYGGYRRSGKKRFDISKVSNKVKGVMSLATKKKIKGIITNWITSYEWAIESKTIKNKSIKERFALITLTLSATQLHTDYYIKRHMLSHFLLLIKRAGHLGSYLWVQEKQSNGNIHFHILIDSHISWQIIRRDWNQVQAIHGYIDRFQREHGHNNPNSTDIHSINKVRNVGNYLIKYMTKEGSVSNGEGILWGCSDRLKGLVDYQQVMDNLHYKVWCMLRDEGGLMYHKGDMYEVINLKENIFKDELMKGIRDMINEHYCKMYDMIKVIK